MDAMDSASPPVSQMQGRENRDAADRETAAGGHRGEVAATEPEDAFGDDLTCDLPRGGWTAQRIARLAYLVGTGKQANEISFDSIVRATPGAVYKMAQRLNIRFRDVPHTMLIRLDAVECAALDAEGSKRGMTGDGLAARVIRNCIEDKLYGAIIDG